MSQLPSRARMLRALDRKDVDHVPACFMSFTALREKCQDDMFALADAELGMGLDTMLFVPVLPRRDRLEHPYLRGLPVRFGDQVRIREWKTGNGGDTVLHKEYGTPAGRLTSSVVLTADWPHGDHIPLLDDFQIPRSTHPVISGPEDLEPLRYLLDTPPAEDVAAFRAEIQTAHEFAAQRQILLAGGWGVGVDMAFWLCGMQQFMVDMLQRPAYAQELLDIIHRWNVQRMRVVLSANVDLFIRRAWYEGCDFVSPSTYKKLILPNLKTEIDLAHERGARFGYICTSGQEPMLDFYREAGVDVLIGVDPIQGSRVDMPHFKQKIGEDVSLWGGVSGAITVEMGSERDVRAAVDTALSTLGPTGFVLSPVDNITVDSPKTWENINVFIDEWRSAW